MKSFIQYEQTQKSRVFIRIAQHQIQGLFGKSKIDVLYLDPVIRAHLEDHHDKIWDLIKSKRRELGLPSYLRSISSIL